MLNSPKMTWAPLAKCVRYIRRARQRMSNGNVPAAIQELCTAWHEHGMGAIDAPERRWKLVMRLLVDAEGDLIQVVCSHTNRSRRAA